MPKRRWMTMTVVTVCALAGAGAGTTSAQTSPSATPRTADGRPDLQGVWDFRTLTPLQRPEDQGDNAVLSAEEVAEIEARSAQAAIDADRPTEIRTEPLPAGAPVGGYNNFWFDRGAGVVDDNRTSLIVSPDTGRIPALQPGMDMVALSLGEDIPGSRPVRVRAAGIGADSWEDRGLAERCLLGFNSGPPVVPAGYNQNLQIFQTPDHVVILHEMVHDARIVPLDGRPHLPGQVRQWMGDSRGYWDGDTLVVHSKNYTDKTSSFSPSVTTAAGNGTTLDLTERFTRVAEDTLLYEFTVEDPTTFTAPITAQMPMKRGEPMFEYACHEGNYGLPNILAGARQAENASR
ncbi:MAG: hypothetical protein O3A25_15725 [Acidobacteria bacterium]|nr:hypothetical protein [Acidobacteriota bacterium]